MIKYSFMGKHSNCTEADAIELIKTTNKPLKFTYGLGYRNPTTYKVPISAEDAISNMKKHYTDVTEYEDYVHINSFSDNDLW